MATALPHRLVSAVLDRLRPLVPPSAWSVLATANSYRAGGPLLVHPGHRRVLVLAPHPDDEVLGCGGTVGILARDGARVRTVIASDGDALGVPGVAPLEVGRRRRAEAVEAAGALGLAPPVALGLPDGHLADHAGELSRVIAHEVAALGADVIFAPWPLDDHPDHRALAVALGRAEVPPATPVWAYEVWSSLPANRLVDVGATWPARRAALAAHRTPGRVVDTTGHEALQRWRSVHVLGGSGWAEAFLALPFSEFARLAAGVAPGQVRPAAARRSITSA